MLTPRTVLYAAYLLLSHGIDLSEAVGLNNASSLEPRYPLEQSPADSGEFSFHQKRASCGNGSRCITGSCCGDKCANNCCGHDDGGVGCGLMEKCAFDGNVFIGCCPIAPMSSCTGEATRVTVHTPYSTVTFSSDEPGKSKPGSGPGKTTATSSSALDEPTRSNPGPGPEKTTTTSSSALDKPNTGSSPSSDGDSDGDSSTAEPTGDSDDGGTPTGAGETSSPTDDQSPPNAAGIMAPANLRELLALPLVALVAFLF